MYDKNSPDWGEILKKKITKSLLKILKNPEEAIFPAFADQSSTNANNNVLMSDTINIKVAGKTFTAILSESAATKAFKAMLPITVSMTELNGNEKFCRLPNSLPVNASNPGTIESGDLLLYGSNTLVLFYETFKTSYDYTKLGKIVNTAGLKDALGSGNVTVSYEPY